MPQRGNIAPSSEVANLDVGVARGRSHVHVLLCAFRDLHFAHWLRVVLESVDAVLRPQVPDLDFGVHRAASQQMVARKRAVLRGDARAL